MSSITIEQISRSADGTHFSVEIRNFKDKMMSWRPGRVVRIQPFYHDNAQLQLEVYPNGNSHEDEGYVSLYLINLSQSRSVYLEGNYSIKNYKHDLNFFMETMATLGSPKFFDHNYLDEYDTDEDLKVRVTITKAWRDHKGDDLSMSRTMKETYMNVVGLSGAINGINSKLDGSNKEINSKLDALVKDMQALKTVASNIQDSDDSKRRKVAGGRDVLSADEKNRLIPKPECPICTNEMTPTTKIAHCVQGHFICWTCRERLAVCPSCSQVLIGRAFGMENYIKTLFN